MNNTYINHINEFLNHQQQRLNGYYNHNYVITIERKKYLLRIPIKDATIMDIRLIPEKVILDLIEANGINGPRVIFEYHTEKMDCYLHNYIQGNTIEELYPEMSPMPDWVVARIAHHMSEYHSIQIENFEDVRQLIPWKYESKDFYNYIYDFNRRLIEKYWSPYQEIYEAFHFPKTVDKAIIRRVDKIKDSPFCLCHADIHRKNVLIQSEKQEANIIDWELSLIGTLYYDISIHFHKMRYIKEQEELFFDIYSKKTGIDLGMLKEQVDLFRELEEIKSVSIDVIRYITDIKDENISEKIIESNAERYNTKLIKVYDRWKTADSERVSLEFIKDLFFSYRKR